MSEEKINLLAYIAFLLCFKYMKFIYRKFFLLGQLATLRGSTGPKINFVIPCRIVLNFSYVVYFDVEISKIVTKNYFFSRFHGNGATMDFWQLATLSVLPRISPSNNPPPTKSFLQVSPHQTKPHRALFEGSIIAQ